MRKFPLLNYAIRTAICVTAHALPRWMLWRRVQHGYAIRGWYRRVIILR
jgi:hypothetical protein